MATRITQDFEHYLANKTIENDRVIFNEFVFANIPNLTDDNLANYETLPTNHIVHRQEVGQAGLVNENTVVYSVTLGTEVGDFDFNYLALVNKELNVVACVVNFETIRKFKNKPHEQGNAITRSVLLEFSGAQQLTQITVLAKSWQIDFSARLQSVDDNIQACNKDIYGRSVFFDNGFLVQKISANKFRVKKGIGYVNGIRVELLEDKILNYSAPCPIFIDVTYQGTTTGKHAAEIKFLNFSKSDYVDNANNKHYVEKIADIASNSTATDRRRVFGYHVIDEIDYLKQHKEDNIQRSDRVDYDSSTHVATAKAVKTAYDKASSAYTKAVQADTNADGRVSKLGDTMTGNLEINGGTYSGLILGAGSHNNKLIIENNNNSLSNSSILNIILRKNGYSGDNHSIVSIPNKNGQVLLDTELSSSVESNNRWIPASSLAVKTAYDKAVKADNNANSRVSKAGDTMTGNLVIHRSDYSEIKLRNNANKDLFFGGVPDNTSIIGNIIYRDVASYENISLIRIPKKNGTMLLNSHFTGSISRNGWCRLPNGLIMQWLTFTSPCSSKRSWPIAFTQIFNVTASQVMNNGSSYTQNFDQDIFYTTTQVWGRYQKEVRVFAVGI